MFHSKYIVLLISIFLLVANCNNKKVSSNHGFKALEVKMNKISINESNKNDILKIIGPPSFKSGFDNNLWFYVERRKTNQPLRKLGIKKIEINNTLALQFDNTGILQNKKIVKKDQMNDLKFSNVSTQKDFKQNNFLFNVFSSLREKMNAPSKKRISE
tara:strand:+ start:187 stop:660 length:474 start_codon:yes stop_codon:yes gene_type:complete